MADGDITAQVLAEVSRKFHISTYLDDDDDVFLDQTKQTRPDSLDLVNEEKLKMAAAVKKEMAERVGGRPRRTSDVIDSLGEEVLLRRGSTEVTYIPVSPSSRFSSDTGYCGSFASSPQFNFPVNKKVPDVMDSKTFQFPAENREDLTTEMPVSRDSEFYNMNHSRRGRAIIINNDMFDNNLASPRKGSQMDVRILDECFSHLGFEVTLIDNPTYMEIKTMVRDLAQEDHSDADCLIVTVLSHGMENGLLYARDSLYPVDSLWTPFTADNCLTLAGKPKIFFVQACRGDRLDSGVNLIQNSTKRVSVSETDTGSSAYKIPSYSDFLICYSSMHGFYSWRNPEDGTWFIQALAQELKTSGTSRNLIDLMTRVNRNVALHFESYNVDHSWLHQQKQSPVFHSSLLRDLIFVPKTNKNGG